MSKHRFDHDAAFAIYVELEPPNRTYREVARRVAVSETSIRRVARLERWEERLREHGEKMVAKSLKTREQRMVAITRIFDRALDRVDAGLDDLETELLLGRLPELHRVLRLELGEATDHVALAEVQDGFRKSMRAAVETVSVIAGEMLSGKQATDFVERFRSLYFDAVNEALAAGELEAGADA